ncbi:hypothetical protein G6F52_013650 [Rhizopus delemar]|nr:hypothetical protein G6F52_013650 [Rhizopus delemar]
MEGRPALCEPGAAANTQGTLLGGDRRLHIGSEYINHHTGVSCFAEYAVVSRRSCVKVNVELSHREAALFGCAVLTGAGAVLNRARIKAGDTAAIVGLGGVGLSALLAAVAAAGLGQGAGRNSYRQPQTGEDGRRPLRPGRRPRRLRL